MEENRQEQTSKDTFVLPATGLKLQTRLVDSADNSVWEISISLPCFTVEIHTDTQMVRYKFSLFLLLGGWDSFFLFLTLNEIFHQCVDIFLS